MLNSLIGWLLKKPKVGFAFLSRVDFANKKYYGDFFENLNCNFKVAIHSKDNARFELPFDCHFINSIDTQWGHISLIEATILLFENLFHEHNCDIVYLLSDDTLPLKKSKNFIYNNISTTFTGFTLKKLRKLSEINKHSVNFERFEFNYKKTSKKFKEKISLDDFIKQNMFFCISKNDFLDLGVSCNSFIEDTKCWRARWNCGENKSPLGDIQIYDEWFWVNMMQFKDLDFSLNENFITCDFNWPYRTQAVIQQSLPQHINDKYIFARKFLTEPHNLFKNHPNHGGWPNINYPSVFEQ